MASGAATAGFIQIGWSKIPWHFPNFSLTKFRFSWHTDRTKHLQTQTIILKYCYSNSSAFFLQCLLWVLNKYTIIYLACKLKPVAETFTLTYKISWPPHHPYSQTKPPLVHRQTSSTAHSALRSIEPPHDKTNKMTMHPVKTQISLGIVLISLSLRCALNR